MLVTELNHREFFAWLEAQTVLAVDTETTGLDPYRPRYRNREADRICGLALHASGVSWYLPVRHGNETPDGPVSVGSGNMPLAMLHRATAILNRIVDNGGRLLFWNAKFDLHMLCFDGFRPDHRDGIDDYMLAAHLVNENEPKYGLKEIAVKYGLGRGKDPESALKVAVLAVMSALPEKSLGDKNWKGHLWRLRPDLVEEYATSDVEQTWQFMEMVWPAIETRKLGELFAEQCAYNLTLFRMERRGILLDVNRIEEHKASMKEERRIADRELQVEIQRLIWPLRRSTPHPGLTKLNPDTGNMVKRPASEIPMIHRIEIGRFNAGSPSQIMAVFPHWPKTDVAYIDSIEKGHPDYHVAQLILDNRVLSKMEGTYYDAYLSLIDADGVLRPNYNLHGTVTGRLSCSHPNLQNVPRYTPRRRVKEVFIARPGYKLVEIDYKQAELRIAAHYGREKAMQEILAAGRDAHLETALHLGLGKEGRHIGKTLNFAVIYGAGIRALTKLLKCHPDEARALLNEYRQLYPGFFDLADATQECAERRGAIRMVTGRYCNFWFRTTDGKKKWFKIKRAKPDDTGKRFMVETRKAMNRLIQGTSSEMLRVAMQRLDDAFADRGLDAHLLLQVHDSIVFEVRDDPDTLEAFRQLVRPLMTDFPFYPAPDIEAKWGYRWSDLEEWSEL